MQVGNIGQDSSAARLIVLWIASTVTLSVRLEFLGFFLFCSRLCHSPGRYDQPIEFLPFSFMHLLPCLWIFGRSAVHDSPASFEVVCDGVSWLFWHRFFLSGFDICYVKLSINVT